MSQLIATVLHHGLESVALAVPAILVLFVVLRSFWTIGPTEVGLVRKRFGPSLKDDSPIAFAGEAGYQAGLLMPGLRFKLWPLYTVTRHPMVQIPAGQIGVVIAQVGQPLPIGAKSAVYRPEFGAFDNVKAFAAAGGQKGVQRPVLSPGTVAPIHPVGFLVITRDRVYGVPIDETYVGLAGKGGLTAAAFGLTARQLEVVRIQPTTHEDGKIQDMIGIVTALEGGPLPKGAIANRLGDFDDLAELETEPGATDAHLVEALLSVKNEVHNNYQDFQAFLDHGGCIGLQHDPLLYGAYNLNPFLVSVELTPMLVVQQGQVAVIKAYVGLATEDTSGTDFKFSRWSFAFRVRITFGPKMPFGSASSLIRHIMVVAFAPHSDSRNGAMLRPVPCSAFNEPSYVRMTRSTSSFMNAAYRLWSSGSSKSATSEK